MDKVLAQYLLSERARGMDSEVIRVYLILYADVIVGETVTSVHLKRKGILGSGLSVHTIALLSGLPVLTVKRKLDDLSRRQWVKRLSQEREAYQIGTISNYEMRLFVGEAVKPKKHAVSMLDQVRQRLREDKARKKSIEVVRPKLSKPAERAILEGVGIEEKATSVLMRAYKKLYYDKYKKNAPLFPGKSPRAQYRASYGALRNYHNWCSNDIELGLRLMAWAFKNWEKIRDALGSPGGRLDINGLCTKKLHAIMYDWMSKGSIPEARSKASSGGIAKRVDKDEIAEAKETGW